MSPSIINLEDDIDFTQGTGAELAELLRDIDVAFARTCLLLARDEKLLGAASQFGGPAWAVAIGMLAQRLLHHVPTDMERVSVCSGLMIRYSLVGKIPQAAVDEQLAALRQALAPQ